MIFRRNGSTVMSIPFIKTKKDFSCDISLPKSLYLAQERYVQMKCLNPVFGWKQICSQLMTIFEERDNADTVS